MDIFDPIPFIYSVKINIQNEKSNQDKRVP